MNWDTSTTCKSCFLVMAVAVLCGTTACGTGQDPSSERVTLQAPEIGLADGEGTYTWHQVSGPPVELEIEDDPRLLTFTPVPDDSEQTYDFVVDITADGVTGAYSASAVVPPVGRCLGNRPPGAVAAKDFILARLGETVVLNAGNSTDPDGDELFYSWHQVDLARSGFPGAGGPVELFEVDTAGATFLALEPGGLLFTVEVSDSCYTVSHSMAVTVLPDGGPCADIWCLPGSVCDPLTRACTVPCDGVVCPDGQSCDNRTGECSGAALCSPGQCNDDDPCTEDECDPSNGLCTHVMVECGPGFACDPFTGDCMAEFGCSSDDDCLEPETCNQCSLFCMMELPSIVSRFDDGDDGWLVTGNDITRPSWRQDGGRSAGHVTMQDGAQSLWYWTAPQVFLGDQAAAYGHALTFDLCRTFGPIDRQGTDVILEGGGLRLNFDFSGKPTQGWTSYYVPLNDAAGWRNHHTGELATAAEFCRVLSALGQLKIRGEHIGPDAHGGLDNVAFHRGMAPVERTANVRTTFDNPDHGWTVGNNGRLGASRPNHEASGGRTGGFAWITDDATPWTSFWDAPIEYLGNVSAAYGRTLSFNLTHSPGPFGRTGHDIVLRGGGIVLYFDTPWNPAVGWTHYAVTLDEHSGWRRWPSEELATRDDITTVLSALGQLRIRAEFRGPGSSAGLDDVMLDLGSEDAVHKTANVVSNFDDADHGWTIRGNAPLGASQPSFEDTGGRTGGYAWTQDNSNDAAWSWEAPAKFLGDVEEAYGRSLSFFLSRTPGANNRGNARVVLRGGGISVYRGLTKPFWGWRYYSLRLDDQSGWLRGSGELATQDDMRRVLSALGQMHIRGEYEGPGALGAIDDVVLDLGSAPHEHLTEDVVMTFDDGDRGWMVVGNGALGASIPFYSENGGHPAGHVHTTDSPEGWTWYWMAPPEVLGGWSNAYGGSLSFDLFATPGPFARHADDIILRGTNASLRINLPARPTASWTPYSIALDQQAGWRTGTDELATEEQIREVLNSVGQLLIRGEYLGPGSSGGLDNVILDLH